MQNNKIIETKARTIEISQQFLMPKPLLGYLDQKLSFILRYDACYDMKVETEELPHIYVEITMRIDGIKEIGLI